MTLEWNINIAITGLVTVSIFLVLVVLYYLRKREAIGIKYNRVERTKIRKESEELEKEKEEIENTKRQLKEESKRMGILQKTLNDNIKTNIKEAVIDAQREVSEKFIDKLHAKADANYKQEKEQIDLFNENMITEEIIKEEIEETKKFVINSDLQDSYEIREFEKSDFHFSANNFVMGYMLKNWNWIFNPDLSKKLRLIDKAALFLKIQNYFNSLVKDEIYIIDDVSLFKIKQAIWSGNLANIVKAIDLVNKTNGFEEIYESVQLSGDMILKKVLIHCLNHECYVMFNESDRDIYEEKCNDMKRVLTKKKDNQNLTSEEVMIDTVRIQEKEVIDELDKVIGKIDDAEFLWLDMESRTIYLKINYLDIFSKDMRKLLEYYKEKNNINFIRFYL